MANSLFLRFEGALQAWGNHESKFVVRRTADAPTKSAVVGMLCAALGVSRVTAPQTWLPRLAAMQMGVRIDNPGIRWWDYHTVGARRMMRTAEGKVKRPGAGKETLLTRREYLCDASFLVVLHGDVSLVAELAVTLENPKWTLYLGRKCCPPSRPLLERPTGDYPDLFSALRSVPWRKRLRDDLAPKTIDCLLDWLPTGQQAVAPADALVWYDVPLTFQPPSHAPRLVVRRELQVGSEVSIEDNTAHDETPRPVRPRADYQNTEYKKARIARLKDDHGLCVFCKAPASTVQHITYRRAGGSETHDDLRSLCRLCHDAVTMIEYGLGMGLDRIDPEEPQWRDEIIRRREEIICFRSLEVRRRRLSPEEAE